jgi:hypothetical protein
VADGVCQGDVADLLAPVAAHEPWLLANIGSNVRQLFRVQRVVYLPGADDREHINLQVYLV